MSSEELVIEQVGNVLTIKLNRPEVLNAFTLEMKHEILGALELAKSNDEIGAVLFSGSGRSFSAGGDVRRMSNATPVSVYDQMCISKELILAMTELDVPIITAVQGYAAGGATGLVLASDIIFAAEDSKFFFSFARIGLIPDTGGMFFLPRTLGIYRAKEVMFNPKPIPATTAYQWGMVNHIYPAEQLLAESMKYAQELAEGPRRAIAQMKKLANRALICDLSDVLEMEGSAQAVLISTEDHKKGLKAFIDKQKRA
jgi:2-(1,2-epoxy-1,2-dihydrophenyl)acetyl-CoA isomerase